MHEARELQQCQETQKEAAILPLCEKGSASITWSMWSLEKLSLIISCSTTHCCRATGQKGREPLYCQACRNHRSSFYHLVPTKRKKKKKAKHFSSSLSCFTIARQRSTIFTHFWKPATRLLTTSLMAPVQVLFNQVLNQRVGSSNGTWHHRQVICWGHSSQTGHLCLLSPQGETWTSKEWEWNC